MKLLAGTLAILLTTAGLPAFAQPKVSQSPAFHVELDTSAASPQWRELATAYKPRVGVLLAQENVEDQRITELDAKIAELIREREQISLTGPILIASLGLTLVIVGIVGSAAIKKKCDEADDDPTEECDKSKTKSLRTMYGVSAGLAGVATLFSGISLLSLTAERQKLDDEKNDLRRERNRLRETLASLVLRTDVRPGRTMLTMSFDF
jgi:hypothetical protein